MLVNLLQKSQKYLSTVEEETVENANGGAEVDAVEEDGEEPAERDHVVDCQLRHLLVQLRLQSLEQVSEHTLNIACYSFNYSIRPWVNDFAEHKGA